MAYAIAALEEVARFLPEDADRIPEDRSQAFGLLDVAGACLTGRFMQTVPTPGAAIAPPSAPPSQPAAKPLGGLGRRPRSRQPCHLSGAT